MNGFHFGAILGGLRDEWQLALQVIGPMAAMDSPTSASVMDVVGYNAAMASCNRAGRWQASLLVLESLDTIRPSEGTYNAGLTACRNAGSWHLAVCLLADVSAAGLTPDLYSFNTAISAVEAGQWALALNLFRKMGCRDLVSFNTAISVCGKAGCWREPLQLLSQLPRAMLQPDEVSYGAAVDACARQSLWQQALQTVVGLLAVRASVNTVCWNSFVSACGSSKWQLALSVLDAMCLHAAFLHMSI